MLNNIELINFTDMTLDEKKMVLSWRNHPEVKKWMYNSDNISLENHLEYVESLNNSPDKLYFLVEKDKNYIGVIDFTSINRDEKSSEFGLYANVGSKIPGVGRILETICINYAFDVLMISVLKLEVFSDNIQVRNLHKKFHFQETTRKIVNNQEVICMELKNEDR